MEFGPDKEQSFSKTHPDAVYNRQTRTRKAATIIRVLQDYLGNGLQNCSVLDMGCSTGIISDFVSQSVAKVIGIDPDRIAIQYAKEHFGNDKTSFCIGSAIDIPFFDSQFDVVICAQVYEHVPDSHLMIEEINRVLKAGGICYFAAGNRYQIMEPHYRLPFLSWLPPRLSHRYVRLAGKAPLYHEHHLSYTGLKRLVWRFRRVDYTAKIIENPSKYGLSYLLPDNQIKTYLARLMVRYLYALCPGYVWVLEKR